MKRLIFILALNGLIVGCSGEADFSGMIETETLNANAYRDEITSLDRLIFTEAPIGEKGRTSLASEFETLAGRVKGTSSSKFLAIEALEIRRLAEWSKRLPVDQPPVPIRDQWMRIRNNLFDDQAWFARGAADLEYAAASTPTPSPRQVVTSPGNSAVESSPVPVTRPAPLQAGARVSLEGRWRVASMYSNGKETSDAELAGSVWTFEGQILSMRSNDGNVAPYRFQIVETDTGSAMRIQSMSEAGESGWMIYRLDDRGLEIAFYDGLQGRPPGFEQEPGVTEPMLVRLRLLAEP